MLDSMQAEAAKIIRDDIKQSFGRSKTRRGKGKRKHIASAPGQPPMVLTGELKRGVKVKKVKTLHRRVGVWGSEYAYPMEFGTKHMAARPWLRPEVDKIEQRGDLFKT
jgi:hypothetical protein